jgi:signal transduction histidine kinase
LKHHHRGFWRGVRALFLAFLLLPVIAAAQPVSPFTTSQTNDGPVIEFNAGEYILADGLQKPSSGWKAAANPNIYRLRQNQWRTGDFHTLVGRFRFDGSALGMAPHALYTVNMRNQFTVLVNGEEVARNFSTPEDQIISWYRPYMFPIPAAAFRPGLNEIVIHAVSQDDVGIGRVVIGPNTAIRDHFRTEYFWKITAPMAANFAMLVMGVLALLFWLGRRQESELLWLSLSTALWFLRNYQYFGEVTPFYLPAFNSVAVYATYFASVATAAFYFSFTKLPHRNRIVAALFLIGAILSMAHALLPVSNMIFYIPTNALILCVATWGIFDLKRHPNLEHGVLGIAMVTPVFSGIHDMIVAGYSQGWNGSGSYLSVFGGFVYCAAFLVSFGKRALDAFSSLGAANITLEQRIAETRAELAASEEARQELVVGKALAGERERLMQEMHDGIGSNLITALAVARQQKQAPSTIKTLSRALGDLKITVDSLEPIEGDLVALIGNLRHRMAGDLKDAGIICKWEVQPCGSIAWLDSPNALHVLRIFQEAIGNVLTHSGATEMRIGCAEADHAGVAGITAYVADNGNGFDPSLNRHGKGLSNIQARARSLHGVLNYETKVGEGTVVRLWLPYARTVQAAL